MDLLNKLVDFFKPDVVKVFEFDAEDLPDTLYKSGVVGVTGTLNITQGSRKIHANYTFQYRDGNLKHGRSTEYALSVGSSELSDVQQRKFVEDEMVGAFHNQT